MSVYLVDNTKKLERLDDVGYRRMGYRLIMFYKISREMKRRFWDVPLSRFYSYKRLDGVDDELIYKIFTNMTSDEAIAILKKFESKMVFIDEILTHLIWAPLGAKEPISDWRRPAMLRRPTQLGLKPNFVWQRPRRRGS